MRCAFCGAFAIATFCKICSKILADPVIRCREVGEFKIYSFYDYSEIKNLIHSKHQMHGLFVYKNLANFSVARFSRNFKFDSPINIVPIDDKITHGYSHTAILARAAKSKTLHPIYRVLQAGSNVSYSGKDLKFRQSHPRNFKILKRPKFPVILVDDIVTTGTTILEAKATLENSGIDVLCAIVLADARY